MANVTAVSVEEYLTTDYSPDCDYVDDHIEERNLGERPHSGLQVAFITYLDTRRKHWGIRVWSEQRVQTTATRSPFLCIEIFSREDRMDRVEKRLREYLDLGVRFVWLVNPFTHEAWIYRAAGKQAVTDGILRTTEPQIEVPLGELFASSEE